MEALEHSHCCRDPLSVQSFIFSNCFWNYLTAISSGFAEKIKEQRRLPHFPLWPGLHCLAIFIRLWCNKRVWTQSLSIHCLQCSIQRQVSYMPSCGRTKLRLVLYHCNQCRKSVQSFTLWQQATIEITRCDHSIIACSCHLYMVLFFAHILFGVNRAFSATPTERLQQLH